jgi:hypothetical protein
MPTATITSAGPPNLSWFGSYPSVSRTVSAGTPLVSLQAALALRAQEYASLPARVSYSDNGRSEAWDAHRASLLDEIDKLQKLIGSAAVSGGVPWMVSTPW